MLFLICETFLKMIKACKSSRLKKPRKLAAFFHEIVTRDDNRRSGAFSPQRIADVEYFVNSVALARHCEDSSISQKSRSIHSRSPSRSEIRVQHDAVTGLA